MSEQHVEQAMSDDPPRGLRYTERNLWAECPQARFALLRLLRYRKIAGIKDTMSRALDEAMARNELGPESVDGT